MLRISCVVLVLTLFAFQSFSRVNDPKDLSHTYGYVSGQSYSIAKLKDAFPDLRIRLMKAEADFDAAFGTAQRRLTNMLNDKLGNEKFVVFKDQLQKVFDEKLGGINYTREQAIAFIDEIGLRAKGNMESPVKEVLLALQYESSPEQELIRGYIQRYSTKGHAKAKGIVLNCKLPISWVAKEGERPNIPQKFDNQGLDGGVILFMVRNMPEGILQPGDEKVMFDDTSIYPEMLEDKSQHYVSGKKVNIDNQPGAMIVFTQRAERIDVVLYTKCIMFLTVYKGKSVSMMAMSSGATEQEAAQRFEKQLPLFKLVANNIVFPDQY